MLDSLSDDLVQVAAGAYHTIGLKSDGTVVAAGPNGGDYDYGQCEVNDWNLGIPDTTTTTTISGSTTTTIYSSTTTTISSCPTEEIYGDNSEHTIILRYFRDNVLCQTPEGQELIKLYYEWSPVIVSMMEEDEEFKKEVKGMIDAVLSLIEEGVE